MSLRTRYEQLATDRSPYLDEARRCAKLTIPPLFPPSDSKGGTRQNLPKPWQSHGARCVNNLAAKLLLTLFPPNEPFFKLQVDDFTLEKLAGDGQRAEVDKGLNKIERAVQTEIEANALRPSLFESLKQLIVGGNAGIFITPANKVRVFRLSNYVVKRDPEGNQLESITMEMLSKLELPPKAKAMLEGKEEPNNTRDEVELYTGFKLVDDGTGPRWRVWQELGNYGVVPDSEGFYPHDKCPFRALRWTAVDGEDYGRGHVEEYVGDFKSLEGLQKAIVQGSAAAAKVLFLVRPNSATKKETIARSESGDVLNGDAEDVSCVQMQKYNDFKVAMETRDELKKSLAYAFILNAAVQRSGERVTAEEIRFMAQELEETLGGVYSTMSQDLQLPLVSMLMANMERTSRLPSLPKGLVRPTVTTGIEAIGRGNDTTRLSGLVQDLQPFGPAALEEVVDVANFATRAGTARGIAMDGLIRTPDQIAQRQQQKMMSEAATRAAPNLVNAGANMMAQQGAPQNG